ncbi:teichuronic acid biosynthesis glycosyltransferase TuaG [Chitinophaga polysaccharea]|uniref:Teichuronic acid biosynthesis glycosyltransferase TuaG n=1 Tax=Chitinophaga polysaccharea TaxID=1293035 RepID=A0A561Q1Y9_9BACT|nr:glycosyltransferase family 2 protein [Chitinophaga polysaccharea]TWF44329.1 teichuronic acid biosynthesis glycosyltransferase TuaG [Chitinophaga polysaccharea]
MIQPLISIITPAYNVEKYIGKTIESVLNQSYVNWEMIIIDDHSKDGTWKIASEYASNDERIKVIRTVENGGAGVARNTGIKQASGDYIAFLDSDDLWAPTKLEVQITRMLAIGALFSFTAYHVITADDKHVKTIHVPSKVSYTDLLSGCDVGCLTAVYNAKELGKLFFLDHLRNPDSTVPPEILRKWGKEDYVLWLQIAKKNNNTDLFIGIDEPLAYYRKHGGGISSNKTKAAKYQWMVYRNVERLNLLKSSIYFINYTINGLVKHYWH